MEASKKRVAAASGWRTDEANAPFIKKIYRKLGIIFAKPLVNTRVEPNHITVVGFFVFVLSAYLFFRADYASLIVAAILLQVGFIFDYIDGSLARMRGSASAYGNWLDELGGAYGATLIYLGATLGVYSQINQPHILVFGLLGAIATHMKNVTQKVYLNSFEFAGKLGQGMYKKFGVGMFFRYTAPFMITVFTLGAILNKVYWVLIFFGIYGPLYTILQNAMFTIKARRQFLKQKKHS